MWWKARGLRGGDGGFEEFVEVLNRIGIKIHEHGRANFVRRRRFDGSVASGGIELL